MTQAVVASAFARAFYLTGKDDYKCLVVKAIQATLLPIEADSALYAKGCWLWIGEYGFSAIRSVFLGVCSFCCEDCISCRCAT
jgi:hypothetical protein